MLRHVVGRICPRLLADTRPYTILADIFLVVGLLAGGIVCPNLFCHSYPSTIRPNVFLVQCFLAGSVCPLLPLRACPVVGSPCELLMQG